MAAVGRGCVKTRERHVAVGTQRYSRSTLHKVWWYAYHGGNFITVVWKNRTAPRRFHTASTLNGPSPAWVRTCRAESVTSVG